MKQLSLNEGDRDFLKLVCEQAPQGISIEEVRRSIKLLDRIDGATDTLLLEDADHQYLVARFAQMKFVRADRNVLGLYDRIVDAKEAEVKAA